MTNSESTANIAAALAKAQRAIEGAAKDSSNPHFNSKYADLESVREACKEPLAANEIAVIQSPFTDGNLVAMTTKLLHSSGEWILSDPLQVQARDAGPQAVGSCLTYLRRFQLAAMVGIAPADDDAEAAEGRKPNVKAAAQKEKHGGSPQPERLEASIIRPGRPLTKEEHQVRADGAVLLLEVAPAFAPAKMQVTTVTGETLPMFRDEHLVTAMKACKDVLFVMIETAIGKKSGKPYVHAIQFAPEASLVGSGIDEMAKQAGRIF